MKNQTILLPTLMSSAKQSAFSAWLNRENVLFTWALESSVTNKQVCLMAHSSLSFSAVIGFYFVDSIPALLCMVWFIMSLRLCVKGGLR